MLHHEFRPCRSEISSNTLFVKKEFARPKSRKDAKENNISFASFRAYRANYLLFLRPPFDLFGRWVNADAATLLTFAGVAGFRSSSLAFVATRLDVCSLFFFDIIDIGFTRAASHDRPA